MSFSTQGMSGFEKQINRLMDLTYYQVEQMKKMPDKFYLINDQPECTNVIFWYIPIRSLNCLHKLFKSTEYFTDCVTKREITTGRMNWEK